MKCLWGGSAYPRCYVRFLTSPFHVLGGHKGRYSYGAHTPTMVVVQTACSSDSYSSRVPTPHTHAHPAQPLPGSSGGGLSFRKTKGLGIKIHFMCILCVFCGRCARLSKRIGYWHSTWPILLLPNIICWAREGSGMLNANTQSFSWVVRACLRKLHKSDQKSYALQLTPTICSWTQYVGHRGPLEQTVRVRSHAVNPLRG